MAVQMRQTEKDLSSFMSPDKGNSNMAASVEVFAQNKPTEAQDNHADGDKGSGEKEEGSEKDGDVSASERVDAESPQSNVGHRLLVKKGWKAGQGLGKQNQGQVEPIPIVVKQDHLGVGRMQMEMEQAEGTTERRRQLECEKVDSEELQQKYKRNQEREAAKNQSVADLKANLRCDLCDKQYSRHSDLDNHMSSQDHAHKKRLKTLRQREFGRNVSSQKHKESRKVQKLQRRMNDFADAQVKRSSPSTQLSPSSVPLPQVNIDQLQSNANTTPTKSDPSLSKIVVPASDIELPAPKIELPPSRIELPASKIVVPASNMELPPSKIELPAPKIELPTSEIVLPLAKTELSLSENQSSPSESHLFSSSKTEVFEREVEIAPSQIQLPTASKIEVAPSDIELPPSEIELFLSELEMAPAAIQPDQLLPITTVFYTDGSSDAPPLPTPCDEAGGCTPEGKVETQHGTLEVKDSPGKSGVVCFTFAKKASALLLPGAVFAKTKKGSGKGKRDAGHDNSGSEGSPVTRECYPSSPPPYCKAKPQLDFVRFVHSDGHAGATAAVGNSKDNESAGAARDVNGGNDSGQNNDNAKENCGDMTVTKKLLEFHSVMSVDDARQLPWPREMVQHTHVSPNITFCCNPLYFDFTQLRARPSHAKDSRPNGDVEESIVEKKKSHKKHSKKSRSHRSRSERKKRKHTDVATGKTEDIGSAADESKNPGTLHKSKKHKHRKSKKSRKHHHDSIGDAEGVDGEKKDPSGRKHNEKEDVAAVDSKKLGHKGKKKKSHRSKKDKKSSNPTDTVASEKSSVKDESNTKLALGKDKKKNFEKEKKSCEEESSKESELDETAAMADGKKKRKYRKRIHTASCHQDSSDDEGTMKTSSFIKGTKKMIVPVAVKRKGFSSTSELSDNAKETKLLEAKLQKNKKQKVNMVDAIVSSHVHISDVKAVKSADSILPDDPIGAELVKTLKAATATNTTGKSQQAPVVKSDDVDAGKNCDSKNKPKDVGKSKWDTSSDSDLDNVGPVMAKSMAALVPPAGTGDVAKDVDRAISSHSNRSSVRSRKNSGQSEKTKWSGVHRADTSNESSAHEDGDKVAKRKGHRKAYSGSKHSRSRSRSASSKRHSRSYSSDEGRSRSRSYSSDDYSDDYDRHRSHTRTPSRDRRRSHTRTPSRDRRWSRTPSRDRRRSHTRTPSRDRRRSRHGRRSYSSYSRSRSRSNSYSRRSRRRKSRSYSGDRHRRHRSYSRSYSRSRSRSSYSRSRSRSHSPVGSHGRHWPYSREHRYNSATVKSLLPKQKPPVSKRVEVTKSQKAPSGDATKSSTSSDALKKSASSSDTASKPAVTDENGKTSPSKDVSSTTLVDPSKIPTPTADTIPLPPGGKATAGKTVGKAATSQQAEGIPLPETPADDNAASNIFQPIGPNDPLVFKVPLPPPPPPGDGSHAKVDAPPLPDGAAPPSDTDGKNADSFMIPPEQVERYKQLRQQAQIHARQRILAQRRLEAGYENDSDEDEVEEEEEDPQQQLMLEQMDPQLQLQQMEMLPQQLLIPQQLASQPMHHVMSLSPGGVPASLAGFVPSAHTLSGLQPAMHMVPQAGAPVMVAAPSAGAGHLMQQMMPSNIVHVMGPGGVPIAVQQVPSQQQLLQQQIMQQQLAQHQLLQQQQLLQQPMLIQAGGAPGLVHAAPGTMSVVPQIVPVAQQLPNGQVIVGQQLVMSRVMRPHM